KCTSEPVRKQKHKDHQDPRHSQGDTCKYASHLFSPCDQTLPDFLKVLISGFKSQLFSLWLMLHRFLTVVKCPIGRRSSIGRQSARLNGAGSRLIITRAFVPLTAVPLNLLKTVKFATPGPRNHPAQPPSRQDTRVMFG
ncbi:MAG: hypothetical protein WCL16_02970, partial [bacterium]